MGGKVWSDLEEEVFWTRVARLAPPGLHKESKVVKKGRGEIAKSWAPLVSVMKKVMADKNPGKDLPRKYTPISIYEHHFQNLIQGKLSPNAGRHVEAHRAWLKTMAENPKSAFEVQWSGSFTSVESDSSELTASNASLESESHATPENSTSSIAISHAATPQQSQQMYQPQQILQPQHMQQPQQSQHMPQDLQMLQMQQEDNSKINQQLQVLQRELNEIKGLRQQGLSQVGNGVPAYTTAHTNGRQFQCATERIPVTYGGPMVPTYHPLVNGVQYFHSLPPHNKNQH